MQKNVANQKWIVFAFDRTDNTAKTNDATNITANLRLDGGAANGVDDTNPSELEDGYYVFDITQAETNADMIVICPVSTTSNIQVIGVPGVAWTTPAAFPTLTKGAIIDEFETQSQADPTGFHVNVKEISGTAQTANDNGADVNAILVDTNELQTDWVNGGRLDLIIDAILSDTGTTLNTHLLDIKGTGFIKDTHSLPQCLTATGFSTHNAAAIWNAGSRALSAPNDYKADVSSLALEATLTAMKGATFNGTTDSLEALRNRGDAAWITATGFSTHSAADIWGVGTRALTDKAGFSLAAAQQVQLNTQGKSDVKGEAGTALTDIHLDHIFASDYNPAAKPGVATALLNELIEDDGGVSRYTANALEQAPSGGTNPNVLVSTTIANVTDQTHFTLTAGSNDDDVYKNQSLVVYDASNSDFPSVRKCSAYAGATKTITLDTAPDFTITVGDGAKAFVTAPGTTAPTAGQNADAVWDEATSGHVGANTFGAKNQKVVPSENLTEYKATGFSTHNAAAVWNVGTRALTDKTGFSISGVKTTLDALNDITAANVWAAGGRELTSPNNYKADVSSLALEATLTAIKGATFSGATDCLEALRNRGDTAWLTAAGFSTHSAADVWAVGTRELTDKIGFTLSTVGITAIWDKNISAYTGAKAGTYIKTLYDDWLNAGRLDLILDTIAADVVNIDGDTMRGTELAALASVCTDSRLAELDAANLPTDIATIDTNVDSVLVDTNELQTDWKNGGRLDLLLDAIKVKTDNLPSGLTKNEALSNFSFLMTDSTTNEPKADLMVTVQISKDGGAFANATNTPATEISNGAYKINLTQAERNADISLFKATAAGANQTTLVLISTS